MASSARGMAFRPTTDQDVHKAIGNLKREYITAQTVPKVARDAKTLAHNECPYVPNFGDEQDDDKLSIFKTEEPSSGNVKDSISSTIGLLRDASDDMDSDTIDPLSTECSICTDTFTTSTFPALPSCIHAPDICKTCFLEWLTSQMSSVENITCPSSGCTTILTHHDVHRYAPLDVFTRFDELSMRILLSSNNDFLYCLAKGCSSGQIHDTGVEGPIFRCAGCGFRMCIAHTPVIPFHENETCAMYTQRVERERQEKEAREEQDARRKREEEEASAAEVKKNAVECPGCGVQIHKMSGCDHITCKFS